MCIRDRYWGILGIAVILVAGFVVMLFVKAPALEQGASPTR